MCEMSELHAIQVDLISAAYGDAFDEFQHLREAPSLLGGCYFHLRSECSECRSMRAD